MKAEEIASGVWRVEGDSGNDYIVYYNPRFHQFMCTCLGFIIHQKTCKHIQLILKLIKEKKEADQA